MSDNITSILNDLIETSKDGEKGFRAAAEDTKNAELQAVFLRRAGNCATGASELSTVKAWLSPQSEKFLLEQSRNFLLTTGKMAGCKRRHCC